jgi:hypothetical protein
MRSAYYTHPITLDYAFIIIPLFRDDSMIRNTYFLIYINEV